MIEVPVKAPEPRHEVVKKGAHPDELNRGNYVIVGSFKSRPNAERYSSMLRDAGHESSLGFASDKNVYYVFVYRSGNLEEAREMRNQYRGLKDFQFPNSWVRSFLNNLVPRLRCFHRHLNHWRDLRL